VQCLPPVVREAFLSGLQRVLKVNLSVPIHFVIRTWARTLTSTLYFFKEKNFSPGKDVGAHKLHTQACSEHVMRDTSLSCRTPWGGGRPHILYRSVNSQLREILLTQTKPNTLI
jgi:hypothetical protein